MAATASKLEAAPFLLVASVENAGKLLMDFFYVCNYAFYMFSGIALLFGAYKLKMGDIGGFAKCMAGAALLYLSPIFASELAALFKL